MKTKIVESRNDIPPRIVTTPIEPITIRLPKVGTLCPYTGMARSALNLLILPCEQNKQHPPVRSFVIRQRGSKTGIRLIDFASLKTFLQKHQEESFQEPEAA